jgi:hypothetical protein
MKIFLSALCAVMLGTSAFADDQMPQRPPNPIEVVLISQQVTFHAADPRRMMQLLFRNVGEETVSPEKLLSGLSIVWDGKEYQKNPKRDPYIWSDGPDPIPLKGSFEIPFSPLDFLIPEEALSAGWHTIAARTGNLDSNNVSVLILVKKSD